MSRLIAPIVGGLLGVLTGWILERMPGPGIVLTTGAGFVAFVSGAILAAIFWFVLPPSPVEIKSVFFGASAIVTPMAAALVSALLHFVLGSVGRGLPSPWLAAHRPIIVALLAGVFGALSFSLGGGPVIPMGR
jgi:hypothetical protein